MASRERNPQTITWLHLSDLHSCKAKTGWDARRIVGFLADDLKQMQEVHGLAPHLIFFIGDTAFREIARGKVQPWPKEPFLMFKELDTLIGFAVVMSVVSLLITLITQFISSVMALRGNNLLDALEALFLRFAPELCSEKGVNKKVKNHARELAELVLKRPTISDCVLSMKGAGIRPESWKLATALKSDECLGAIKNIAILDEHYLKNALSDKAKERISVTNAKASAATLIALLNSPEAQLAAGDVIEAVKAVVPNMNLDKVQDKIDVLLAHGAGVVETEMQKWTRAFESVQDRAAHWFTMQARLITIVASFVMAFILQLDAFQLLTRLSTDTDFRNGLVDISKAVQQRADDALNVKFAGTIYSAALKQMKGTNHDVSTFGDAPAVDNYAQGVQWLNQQISQHQLSEKERTAIIESFDNAVQQNSRDRIDAAQKEFGSIAGIYDRSKVQLIPENYPLLSIDSSPPYIHHVLNFLGISGDAAWRHFSGMTAAAMLLSLGAPFWFNLLKSLTNLRSSVAEEIDKQKKPANT